MEGSTAGDVELHVEGAVHGDIHVARLVVGESGRVAGHVRAIWVDVRGRVVGDIEGHRVALGATADVRADIMYQQLSIEPGAVFVGSCSDPAVATARKQADGLPGLKVI